MMSWPLCLKIWIFFRLPEPVHESEPMKWYNIVNFRIELLLKCNILKVLPTVKKFVFAQMLNKQGNNKYKCNVIDYINVGENSEKRVERSEIISLINETFNH